MKLASEKHYLSKIHTRYGNLKSDAEQLFTLVPKALLNWKDCIIRCQIDELNQRLSQGGDNEALQLLARIKDLQELRRKLAKHLGDRVVNPKK